jgi:phage protein D
MILPDICNVSEPASIKITTGIVPIEITDLYPVLVTANIQVSRKEPGIGTLEFTATRDEDGSWPVLDGGYFERWKPIKIVADFGSYSEDIIEGFIVKLTPEFPQEKGTAKVTVEIQDQTIALDREQITKTWGDSTSDKMLTDKSIVASVLAGYQYKLDVDSADGQSRLTLNQDKTDFRFLTELAEAVGYEFRLMNSTVYFGPIKLSGTPQSTILVYAGPDTNCLEFKVDEDAAVPDSATTASVDTQDSGEASEEELTPNLTILGATAANEAANSNNVPGYVWRMRQEGDNPPAAAQMLAQAKINEASLSIKAECVIDSTIYGHVLLPGKLVNVDGIGQRYGGRYYVDAVEHAFDALSYTQKASLLKNGINEG